MTNWPAGEERSFLDCLLWYGRYVRGLNWSPAWRLYSVRHVRCVSSFGAGRVDQMICFKRAGGRLVSLSFVWTWWDSRPYPLSPVCQISFIPGPWDTACDPECSLRAKCHFLPFPKPCYYLHGLAAVLSRAMIPSASNQTDGDSCVMNAADNRGKTHQILHQQYKVEPVLTQFIWVTALGVGGISAKA